MGCWAEATQEDMDHNTQLQAPGSSALTALTEGYLQVYADDVFQRIAPADQEVPGISASLLRDDESLSKHMAAGGYAQNIQKEAVQPEFRSVRTNRCFHQQLLRGQGVVLAHAPSWWAVLQKRQQIHRACKRLAATSAAWWSSWLSGHRRCCGNRRGKLSSAMCKEPCCQPAVAGANGHKVAGRASLYAEGQGIFTRISAPLGPMGRCTNIGASSQ